MKVIADVGWNDQSERVMKQRSGDLLVEVRMATREKDSHQMGFNSYDNISFSINSCEEATSCYGLVDSSEEETINKKLSSMDIAATRLVAWFVDIERW